jgi:hypothetical protein
MWKDRTGNHWYDTSIHRDVSSTKHCIFDASLHIQMAGIVLCMVGAMSNKACQV